MSDSVDSKEIVGLPPVSSEPWVPLPPGEWTEPERWAWERIRTGQAANFNEQYGELDPKNEALWTDEEKKRRGLRADFLRTVLLCEPWRGLITHVGVRIVGACFEERIDLSNSVIDCDLWLVSTLFFNELSTATGIFKNNLNLSGSFFYKELVMYGTCIHGNLMLRKSILISARLHGIKVKGQVGMEEVSFTDRLSLDGAQIKDGLFMRSGQFANVNLIGAEIEWELSMEGAKFADTLAMDGTIVRGHVILRRGSFKSVRLHGAQLKGGIDADAASFSGRLAFDGVVIEKDIFLRQSRLQAVIIRGIKLSGQLTANKSIFKDEVIIAGSSIEGEIFLGEAVFHKKLSLLRTTINGGMFMSNGRFNSMRIRDIKINGQLDLNLATFSDNVSMSCIEIKSDFFLRMGSFVEAKIDGIQVGGQLAAFKLKFRKELVINGLQLAEDFILSEGEFKDKFKLIHSIIRGRLFCRGASFLFLDLTDTIVDAFYDGKTKDSDDDIWPNDLNLDRFIYNHLRGFGGQDRSNSQDLTDRPSSWFVNWLAKHKPYSPQPYQQCAKVLREAGQPWKAAEVLFAGKERERENSVWYRRAWLWLLRWSVGYGLGWRFKVFPAALGAIVLAAGAIVSFYSPDVLKENHSLGWSLGLSLNRLLPLITLSKDFTDFVFHGWQKAWFIGQALFGWVLAFFIAAGLAGVGKPGGRD